MLANAIPYGRRNAISREAAILEGAIEHFGEEAQVIKSIEELAELQQALVKWYFRGDRAFMQEADLANLREEMADCYIMLNQLSLIFGDVSDAVARLRKWLSEHEPY